MSNVKIQGTAITHQHRITVSAPVSSLCDLCHQFTANSPSAKWVVTQTPNVKCSNQFFLQPFIFVDKRYLFVSCRSVILASYLASRCNVVWKKNYLQSISALLKFLLQHAVRIARSKVLLLVPQIDPSVPQPVVQSRRRPLLGPSPGWKRLLPLSHLRHY